MANVLALNAKVKMVAMETWANSDYLKATKSYLPQGAIQNKKLGGVYDIYLPSLGKVQDGLATDPDDIVEVKKQVVIRNKNTSVNMNTLESLTSIESFDAEIAEPKGRVLGKAVEIDVIKRTIFDSAQATVIKASEQTDAKWGFKAVGKAAAKLLTAAVAGAKTTFMGPEILADMASSGLQLFNQSDIAKRLYSDNYIGQYAGCATVGQSNLPTVTGNTLSGTVSFASGEMTYSSSDANDIGVPATASATTYGKLRLVDMNGQLTENDYVVIPIAKYDAAGKIDGATRVVRVGFYDASGKWVGGHKNPEAGIVATASATPSFTLSEVLEDGKKYAVGVVRANDSVAFDNYTLDKVDGAVNETGSWKTLKVKYTRQGSVRDMTNVSRFDITYATACAESRMQSVIYVEVA